MHALGKEKRPSTRKGFLWLKMGFAKKSKKIPDPKAEDCLFCLSNTNYHKSDTNFQK